MEQLKPYGCGWETEIKTGMKGERYVQTLLGIFEVMILFLSIIPEFSSMFFRLERNQIKNANEARWTLKNLALKKSVPTKTDRQPKPCADPGGL